MNLILQLKDKPGIKRVIQFLSFLIILLVAITVMNKVYDDWDTIDWNNIKINYYSAILVFIVAVSSNLLLSVIWKEILNLFNVHISYRSGFRIQLISQIGKYIPGKVGLVFTKAIECRKLGISSKISMIAIGYEMCLGIYFQVLLGFITLPFLLDYIEIGFTRLSNGLAVGCCILGFVFIHPGIFIRFANTLLKSMGQKLIELDISFYKWCYLILCFICLSILNGLIGYFAINLVYDLPLKHIFYITGAMAWGFLFGFINVLAPSGIGVRDGILAWCYSYLIPAPLALTVAVIIRIVVTLVEWGLIGIAFFIQHQSINVDHS